MMFFSGDSAIKKKVDLGGRSSKERDRQKLLEQTKLEREQRHRVRVQTQSATQIQKVIRGRRDVAALRPIIRNEFCAVYGELGERADREAFHSSSMYLPQLFFFFQASNAGDVQRLVGACCLLRQSLSAHNGIGDLFAVDVKTPEGCIAMRRQKRLASLCLDALYINCKTMKVELLKPVYTPATTQDSGTILLETLLTLTGEDSLREDSLWHTAVMDHLLQFKLFTYLRGILLQVQPEDRRKDGGAKSYLEQAVCVLAKRYIQRLQSGTSLPIKLGFSCQILSIPLLWQRFPAFKQVCVDEGLWSHSIHELATNLLAFSTMLPSDIRPELPSSICLLGNLIEVAESAFSRPDCTIQLATDFAVVCRYLMEDLPPTLFKSAEPIDDNDEFEDEMEIDGRPRMSVPEPALKDQLLHAADHNFLKHLVSITFSGCTSDGPVSEAEARAVGATCAFLYAAFTTLPMSRVITGLAYSAQLVPQLWPYMKRCHMFQSWPPMELVGRSATETQLPHELLGWMLPLCIFSPVYSYLLMSIDNEEFYEQQRPLPLEDLVQLVSILKEALWQLLWVLVTKSSTVPVQKPGQVVSAPRRIFLSSSFRPFLSNVVSKLLAEVHDRNSRRQFTPPQVFHAREAVDESFFAQRGHQALDLMLDLSSCMMLFAEVFEPFGRGEYIVGIFEGYFDSDCGACLNEIVNGTDKAEGEHTRARDLLQQAPFLVPFTDRVRIYTSQLAVARQQSGPHTPLGRLRIKIRRDRIIEDAFTQLNGVPEEALKGTIRVTFVNELGVEEAGVDGGGIFKDFMENITKAAFDVQYGLFKETADYLLYPNPASSMVYDEHLQYFEFLGKILGKAMFEGILVDIPFATFFLSKLRKKHNYLHDLPSLDPELYRSLLFLKHYEGDLSQLAVYFVVVNNEYGEQMEVELLPGGRDIQVTNDNVIKYIHLVANHRLNSQIRQQSNHFLHGFQQLIKTEWIHMFNEQELQILISGSHEGMDVNDLRNNVHYSGGYHEHHPVIEMFWEVMKLLDSDLQQKFLKFVTGCSRGPLLGFKYLEPQFCIQRAAPEDASEETLDRLPTSATCMNLLKLPPYRSKEIIHEKLLYAITAGAGFDLS